jgi:hypothetical protein
MGYSRECQGGCNLNHSDVMINYHILFCKVFADSDKREILDRVLTDSIFRKIGFSEENLMDFQENYQAASLERNGQINSFGKGFSINSTLLKKRFYATINMNAATISCLSVQVESVWFDSGIKDRMLNCFSSGLSDGWFLEIRKYKKWDRICLGDLGELKKWFFQVPCEPTLDMPFCIGFKTEHDAHEFRWTALNVEKLVGPRANQ